MPATVVPTLQCFGENPNGTYLARFGYENSIDGAVDIPVGPSNYFAPGAQNRGQITSFQAGNVANAFSITFNASLNNLAVWFLRGPDGIVRPLDVTTATLECH